MIITYHNVEVKRCLAHFDTIAIPENNMHKEKEKREKHESGRTKKKQMAYIADQECGEEMNAYKRILHELNTVDRTDGDAICEIVKRLFGKSDGAFVNPPFYCDYGKKYRGR